MRSVLLALVTTSALLSGCAGIVRSDPASEKVYRDVSSAVLNTRPIGHVDHGSAQNVKIGDQSPSLDADSIKGRFEIVTVRGEMGKKFEINSAAVCDCFGFRKYSVVPVSFLADTTGRVVFKADGSSSQTLKGVFPADGTYHLVIVADKSKAGFRIGEIKAGLAYPSGFKPDVLTIPMTGHPTGLVRVKYE
jgi:hypothetical protein